MLTEPVAYIRSQAVSCDPVTSDAEENYSGQFKLRLPKSLHKQLAEEAKRDGISMNQYCVYLLSQNNALHHLRDN